MKKQLRPKSRLIETLESPQEAGLRVTLFGAAREVTGSCYLLETKSSRILVDCGLFQGSRRVERHNHIPASLGSRLIDCVLLTHGHLDHCGRLPLLCKSGFRGIIYATPATIDIALLILHDAAKIQKDDTDRENRKRKRLGLELVEPLFTQRDVEQVARQFRPLNYNSWLEVVEDINIRFVDAGHILGSASIDMIVTTDDSSKRLVFSGDLGQYDVPIMRDPAYLESADMVFVESTYGDREHRSIEETVLEFERLIKTAVQNKGKILIPTFAVGRTQQILYYLAKMFRSGSLPEIPVYLDSPMAIAATDLYAKHSSLMDEEAKLLQGRGEFLDDLTSLRLSISPEESQALNNIPGPCIILAGAGMCNAGRILHHFRHNLDSADTVVIIVGYQTRGSIGRQMIEGASSVKIFGETVRVRATVKALGGFSAHGGRSDLLRWLQAMAGNAARIVITHGEPNSMIEFAHQIKEKFGSSSEMPRLGDVVELNE